MEGFLEKKGVSGWTERWFVLEGKRVMYYNQKGDRHPRGTLELNAGSRLKKIATKEHAFHVVSDKQALTVNALSGDDRELWMRAIADKVQQLKDAMVVLPKRKGTRMISAWDTVFEVDDYYTYKKPVGHGAYGVVISALDTRDNSKVAIKKIPSAFDDVVDAKRIVREVRLLRRLDHMNIIKIVDILPPPSLADFNDVYIVSELMDTDLHRVIYSSQRLSDQHVKYFLYQILCGVKYIHSASVLHRDLKPSNILLSTNCDLKLCDFGLSRGVSSPDEEETAELTEYVVTRWYRSPEIMLAAEYGYPIDIWSVGCIFAEMLRREPLFRGETYLQMLKLIAKFVGKPRDESELAFVTNPKAQKFMEDLPEYPPADLRRRFPSAGADAVDLLARMLVMRPDRRLSVDEALRHPYLRSLRDKKAETTALEPVDFADVELAPLNKNNLRRLMHEDVLAYRPELRSPAAGSSLPEPAVRTGGREAARDGGVRGSSGVAPPPPPNGNGGGGTNGTVVPGDSHVSSRVANGGSANMHAGGAGGAQRERSSRSDPRDGRSSGGLSGSSGRSTAAAGSSSGRAAVDSRTHAAARVRSGGAVARHPFPTEG
ncbi:unnamed protein product [Scytosiphon promiscuus]